MTRRMDKSARVAPRAVARELHWAEYAIEAALLAMFMVSACVMTVLLEHPASPAHRAIPDAFMRRALIGVAMGLTAIALIYSPWGMRSGAHFNPAVTLTYLRLGAIAPRDACAYVVAQGAGGIAGVLVVALALGPLAGHPAVRFAATTPGADGSVVAFAAELAISFVLMTVILWVSNGRFARATGVICGAIVATYITFEAPYSGMSMNPARSLASALGSGEWASLWIYVSAPPLAMLAAAELHLRLRGARRVRCAKLHHGGAQPCIFRCGYDDGADARQPIPEETPWTAITT